MADQSKRQNGRGQRRPDIPSSDTSGLNMSLLDWSQLEPLGETEALAAAGQDLDFLPDLADEVLDDGALFLDFHLVPHIARCFVHHFRVLPVLHFCSDAFIVPRVSRID